MKRRTLTIRLDADWQRALRRAGVKAKARRYQGEVLNFESPATFFGQLTERRWELVRALQGREPATIRELGRHVGRDVKRVHEDVRVLIDLGLLERVEGGVTCPFVTVHIDMELRAARIAA
jgi:predicted transcriptional regulator